jgi:hypothetical protein
MLLLPEITALTTGCLRHQASAQRASGTLGGTDFGDVEPALDLEHELQPGLLRAAMTLGAGSMSSLPFHVWLLHKIPPSPLDRV